MLRTITIAAAVVLITASAAFAQVGNDRGPFGSACGGGCQTPDGGYMSRSGQPGDYRYTYTPPSYPNTQAPYNGAYRSNPYDNGNGPPSRDYFEEQRRYQSEPRDAYGAPSGGYRF